LPRTATMIIVVMGVAGAGKTTIGTLLAERLGYPYLEGDALHPPANIEAMRRGRALSDADRAPWLAAIRARLVDVWQNGRSVVVGCSALKASYRAQLSDGLEITWVYLEGPAGLIRARLRNRTDHFFGEELLDSQLATLEAPHNAITVDVSLPPATIVAEIMARIDRPGRARGETP
jgi:gluconokinase